MNILNYLKKLKDAYLNGSKKKLIENCVIVVILGIMAIIAGGGLFGNSGKVEPPPAVEQKAAEAAVISKNSSSEEEERIEGILSMIEGAGKVDVMVTYSSSTEKVPALDIKKNNNETKEKDGGGGDRFINQEDYQGSIAYEEEQGGIKKPIIVKEMSPDVKGVVVVADGAGDPEVREKLAKAVQTLLGVPVHKVDVFERIKKKG